MSRIVAIYLAPDYFYLQTDNDLLVYSASIGCQIPFIKDHSWDERYIVAKGLIGTTLQHFCVLDSVLYIDIDNERYCVLLTPDRERMFYKLVDHHILATDKEWSKEEILAQKHGTVVRFTIECIHPVSSKICSDFNPLTCTVAKEITHGSYTEENVFHYYYWIEKSRREEFTKLLKERNVKIIEKKAVRPRFEKLV